jgi:plastocyanin
MKTTENFDSRALRYTDAYGQRFMREGTYQYSLATAGSGLMGEHFTHTIKVEDSDKGHKMKQHNIIVSHKDKTFSPDDSEISIKVGDLVMWCCRQPSAPPFEVVGEKEFFGSANMVNECGYAHAFGTPGKYHWGDVINGKVSGVVNVLDPKCKSQAELSKWQKQLSKGTLVMISDGKVTPREVEILTGQTVYFAIVKSDGISITDQRSVDATIAVNDAIHGQRDCNENK